MVRVGEPFPVSVSVSEVFVTGVVGGPLEDEGTTLVVMLLALLVLVPVLLFVLLVFVSLVDEGETEDEKRLRREEKDELNDELPLLPLAGVAVPLTLVLTTIDCVLELDEDMREDNREEKREGPVELVDRAEDEEETSGVGGGASMSA